jgi:uncharacterized pyridoxamine 5'-phosphate oxidase family protein
MTAEEVEAFLKGRTMVALATVHPSGTPHVSATDLIYHRGRFFLGQSRAAASLRNLQRQPRISLLMAQGWRRHLLLEGEARELPADDSLALEVRTEERRRAGFDSEVIVEVEPLRLLTWKSATSRTERR